MSTTRRQPPYFHARVNFAFKPNRFYRVYLLPDELLFIPAGPGDGSAVAMGAAAGGGAVGGLIGYFIMRRMQNKTAARGKQLDEATREELQQLATEEKQARRCSVAELAEICLEPPSAWRRMLYNAPYAGLLRFKHPAVGTWALELPSPEDVHVALGQLPDIVRDRLTVRIVWNEKKSRYVRKEG